MLPPFSVALKPTSNCTATNTLCCYEIISKSNCRVAMSSFATSKPRQIYVCSISPTPLPGNCVDNMRYCRLFY
jgi:hypothetical protein